MKLVCNLNSVYGNIKSENPQDFAKILNEIVRSWIHLQQFSKSTLCDWWLQEVHNVVDDVAECETVYDEKCHQEQVTNVFFRYSTYS